MKFGPDAHIPASPCPHCGKVNDGAGAFNHDDFPTPGMISICVGCKRISIFNEDLTTRKPTTQELIEIQNSPIWSDVVEAIAVLRLAQMLQRGRGN